jgi:hypothetical protein
MRFWSRFVTALGLGPSEEEKRDWAAGKMQQEMGLRRELAALGARARQGPRARSSGDRV